MSIQRPEPTGNGHRICHSINGAPRHRSHFERRTSKMRWGASCETQSRKTNPNPFIKHTRSVDHLLVFNIRVDHLDTPGFQVRHRVGHEMEIFVLQLPRKFKYVHLQGSSYWLQHVEMPRSETWPIHQLQFQPCGSEATQRRHAKSHTTLSQEPISSFQACFPFIFTSSSVQSSPR